MKTFGILLIIVGIGLLVYRVFVYQKEKEIAGSGLSELNKKEKKPTYWTAYTGVLAIVAGIAIVIIEGNKQYKR